MSTELNKWLANLKVGDQVIVSGMSDRIATVHRLTKTMIIILPNGKFNRNTGWSVGGYKTCGRIVLLKEATPERILKINAVNLTKKLRNKMSDIDIKALSDSQMEEILKIVENKGE